MNLGRTRLAGATLAAAVLAVAGTAQAQLKPKYPITQAQPMTQAPPPAPAPGPAPASEGSEGWMTET
jgi:hypothetical protein